MLPPLSQLTLVEKQKNLAINVYGWEDHIAVHRASKVENPQKTINLFLATNGEKHHYTLIKNLKRLLYDQTKHDCKQRKPFCERCLQSFTRQDLLEKRTLDHRGVNQAAVAIEMPKPRETITLCNYRKQLKAPYIIYAGFESTIRNIQG